MYAEPLSTPARAADANGRAISGARWFFYASGTTTLQAAFTAPTLAVAHPNPVVADNDGIFAPVYFDPAKTYRAVLRAATGTANIMDIDPVNPALFSQLKTASGAGDVGFAQSGSGAVLRTVRDKLRNSPVDVADFGAIGTADDTATFTAAYAAAKAASRPLRLPAGRFAVSGLVFEGNIPVAGAGAGNTIFVPTGDGQTVVKLIDRTSGLGRGAKVPITDFGIDLSGRANCTGLYTWQLLCSAVERIKVVGSENGAFAAANVGWRSVADQYSAFREIYVEGVSRGLVVTSDPAAGGGVNNHYDGLHVSSCLIGVMIFSSGVFPFGVNHFTNLRIQASHHCSLYLSEVQGLYFSMYSPDADTATTATRVFEGRTIKSGIIHADGYVSARFDGYDHVNNDPAMRVRAENHSSLQFDVSRGAAIQTEADATSAIRWEGTWGNGSIFRNTRVSLATADGQKTVVAWHPADCTVSPTFPNECAGPLAVPLINQFGCTSALGSDAEAGIMRQVAFAAQPGSDGNNAIWVEMSPQDFQAGDVLYGSILLRSDRDTQIVFDFAQSVSNGAVELKAGQWTRLFVCNKNGSGGPRYTAWSFWPLAGDQPQLRIARPVACRNLSAQQARMLSEAHCFNPRDPAGEVLRLAAPPSAGTWLLGTSVLNSAPSAAGAPGWTCVAAGTPGTWKAMSPLAA